MTPTRDPFRRFRVDLDPSRIELAATRLREVVDDTAARLGDSWAAARHLKLRVSWRGHVITPDVPLHVLLVGEGAAVAALGPLLTALANLGARMILDVDVVHDADRLVASGREAWAAGERERAEALLREALELRPDDPSALYPLGLLLRETGRGAEGYATLRKAVMGPVGHPEVVLAAELLARLTEPPPG